ncbi:MAG: ArdC-like ssDNA-binding domain-containing protein, partial [Lachnospiraceae bacterium]|nr:ArdC-like ssDNA-binding domain-containing protein [Lachnospiraceae bacterium]
MAYQRLSTEEKEQRKKELMQKVENIIDNFQRSPADLIEYLKFNSKFYQYSKNNNALIYQENKYAQYCGSFKHFKDMGYSVKKGERGIKILVPYISKYFYNTDTEEWKKVSEATPEQKQKIKNGEIEIKQYTSFGVGTVFDISQTNCPVEDYPKFFGFGHASQSHRELFNAVKYYAENKGIPVEITDLKSITLAGFYNTADNSIELSDKLNDDRLLSVMTHELSHALLHNLSMLENNSKTVMQIEFEADALSLLLRERLGISDVEEARQAHLQTSFNRYMEWAEENRSEQHCPTLSEILDNINDAYSNMVEDFDNSISHYFELHPDINQSINSFSQKIDDFINGKINPTDHIFVCSTTEVMKVCGADNLDVMIYQDTIRKILSNDFNQFEHPHNLSVETLKQLPAQLQKPIMVFKGSHEGSIVLVTDLQNENSQQIIISCELDSGSEWNKINRVTSMYGKENIANYLSAQIKKDNLIGCQKNIANQMLHSVGLYLPSENTFIDYTNIISDINKNVNITAEENIISEKIYSPNKETSIQNAHLKMLQTIAEYERDLNVSTDERIVEMNYSTAHWQPKENITPNQVEALYNFINDSQHIQFDSANNIRLNSEKVPLTADEYYQNLKNMAYALKFNFGDESSLDLNAINNALAQYSIDEVIYKLDDNHKQMFIDYIEQSLDYSENIGEKEYELYKKIIEPQSQKNTYLSDEENIDKSEKYNADADELKKLFNISQKLNEQNLQPIDVLQDKKLIDFYSFSCNINKPDTAKELLWKIHQNDMQVVAVSPTENGYTLNCIGQDLNMHPFNNTVYENKETALSEAYSNNQISKLVDLSILKSCSVYKDLSIISKADNLKYPHIKIHWTDSE